MVVCVKLFFLSSYTDFLYQFLNVLLLFLEILKVDIFYNIFKTIYNIFCLSVFLSDKYYLQYNTVKDIYFYFFENVDTQVFIDGLVVQET